MQSLCVNLLLFGSVIWCCIAPTQLTLAAKRLGSAVSKELWYTAETHVREMLRWAVLGRKDLRTGLIYLASGVPTA